MDDLAFDILDQLIDKDENGRPANAHGKALANDVLYTIEKKGKVGLYTFCEAVREMYIMSLVDAQGFISKDNVHDGAVVLSVTNTGVNWYLTKLRETMQHL